ncbi:MAG TPA: S9 family peptidase [Gemmatimonadaceae bacterium]|nr:S9 family peptidase [Gemmatimonadaceae bacterium]
MLKSVFAAIIIAAPLYAQLTPEQVTALQNVTSVAISPDARWVAYTLAQPRAPEEDTLAGLRSYSELWVIPVAGGQPRAIAQRPNSAGAPVWSPDGQLGFVARGQVQLAPATCFTGPTCETRTLTSAPSAIQSFAWSPDGQWIAYTSRVGEPPEMLERRRRGQDVVVASELNRPVRLYVRRTSGGDARAVSPDTHTVREFVWAPDARTLAFQSTTSSDADADQMYRRIYSVTTDGGTPRLVTRTEGKLGQMAWSPDGSKLAFLGAVSFNDPLAQSVFVATPGSEAINLTPAYEGSALSLSWQDARTIRFVAAEGTKAALNTVPAAGGNITRVLGHGPQIFSSASFSRDGATFALPANTATHPNEVHVGTMRERTLRRITNHNAWLANVQLGRQQTVEWRARDGWRIQGVLVSPVGATQGSRPPLAVLPHGGPEGISFDGWVTNSLYPAQVLAAAGYAVFMPNYRGSGGRGVAFSKGDHRDLGGREFDDVLDGITHLHDTGAADSTRVGISGTSYGGFFSAWAGTKHSERFRLAMPFAGISNWMSFTGTTDIPVEMAMVHWDLWPYEHPMLMWERSPLAYIGKANTPMIIGQGLVDERVHPEQMIQLHQALRLKGVPSELVTYPREPHGLLERQHQLDYMRRIITAFDKYVKPGVRPRV